MAEFRDPVTSEYHDRVGYDRGGRRHLLYVAGSENEDDGCNPRRAVSQLADNISRRYLWIVLLWSVGLVCLAVFTDPARRERRGEIRCHEPNVQKSQMDI